MRGAGLIFLLIAGLAVVVPTASLAQSAGDEQYVDPFQDEPQQGGSGGGDEGSGQGASGGSQEAGGGGEGTQTGAETGSADDTGATSEATPPASATEGGGFGASATGASPSGTAALPRTGPPFAPAVLLGAVLLAAGLALRRFA